ncbi:hypothetical protein CXF85_11175 [Colwellia sp. 75C3]|uniref:hypothetical protein n=1 Tax=Colwellia sp. 75C3 TaxID=888425 RepID=UPI000C3217F8|nr:hypothetical protein [Colwellia sp. 75C3]PKG83284.1 hypothetical protein CXF85_11175 [Colwellia sp. 75C3]
MIKHLNKLALLTCLAVVSLNVEGVKAMSAETTPTAAEYSKHYTKAKKREKGPVRISFTLDHTLTSSADWDDNFYKRHIVLREIKKGGNRYLYEFENDLMDNTSKCYYLKKRKYVSFDTHVNMLDVQVNQSKANKLNYRMNIGLSTKALATETYDELMINDLSFKSKKLGKFSLNAEHKRELRQFGFNNAKNSVMKDLNELISYLHQGTRTSTDITTQRIADCLAVMEIKVNHITLDAN